MTVPRYNSHKNRKVSIKRPILLHNKFHKYSPPDNSMNCITMRQASKYEKADPCNRIKFKIKQHLMNQSHNHKDNKNPSSNNISSIQSKTQLNNKSPKVSNSHKKCKLHLNKNKVISNKTQFIMRRNPLMQIRVEFKLHKIITMKQRTDARIYNKGTIL